MKRLYSSPCMTSQSDNNSLWYATMDIHWDGHIRTPYLHPPPPTATIKQLCCCHRVLTDIIIIHVVEINLYTAKLLYFHLELPILNIWGCSISWWSTLGRYHPIDLQSRLPSSNTIPHHQHQTLQRMRICMFSMLYLSGICHSKSKDKRFSVIVSWSQLYQWHHWEVLIKSPLFGPCCIAMCVWLDYDRGCSCHNNDVILSAMPSQITSLAIVYSTVYSMRRSKKTSKPRVIGLC